MRILAGQELDLRWDGATFAPAGDVDEGPIFRVRGLGYLAAQEYLAADATGVDAARAITEVIGKGLVSVDGSAERAAEFVADPKPALVTPLFNAIWGETWGN